MSVWNLRALCAVANALLSDMDILTPQNALDPSKVQRMFDKHVAERICENANEKQFTCVMFDGRIDSTLQFKVSPEGDLTSVAETMKEEHITIVDEPRGKYREHFSPETGKAKDISRNLHEFIIDRNSELSLVAIGCDGTVVNTGRVSGVIRRLELILDRPLQWSICLLHFNELPFRRLFRFYDGQTSGPDTYTGEIGRAITSDVFLLPITEFLPICGKLQTLPDEVVEELSTDAKYFYTTMIAVQTGQFSHDLAEIRPGRVHEARWLTKASRILRYYSSTPNPSYNLIRLVEIIQKIYGPGYFHIIKHPLITEGAKNFHYLLVLSSSYLTTSEKEVTKPVFSNNAYFAHPRMFYSTHFTIRILAKENSLFNTY